MDKQREKQLMDDWFDTVSFDKEFVGIPDDPDPDTEDNE